MSEYYPPSSEGSKFVENGEQVDLHAANDRLRSYAEVAQERARRDADAAYAQETPEVAPIITPEQRIGQIGANLSITRADYLGMDRRDFELMSAPVELTKKDLDLAA